jgi:hypothetical protein
MKINVQNAVCAQIIVVTGQFKKISRKQKTENRKQKTGNRDQEVGRIESIVCIKGCHFL